VAANRTPVDHGRDAAFTAFVRTSGPALGRTAFFLTGDRHLAEDLVQTALAQTYVHWHRIRDHDQVEAYARRILVNANAAWWRRRSAAEVPVDTMPDVATGDVTAGYAEREPVVAALRALPARQRAALVLRYFEDRSEADTARIMGCTTGSVKRHTARGLERLRVLLGEPAGVPLRVVEVTP
jgi:RNA polymerase sigma-70 factor (sigma-E family)